MQKKKGIRFIYMLCAISIVAAATFFTVRYVFPKAHSGSDYTTQTTESTSETVLTEEKTSVISTTGKPSTANTTIQSTTFVSTTKIPSTSITTAAVSSSTTAASTVKIADDFSILDNCAFIGNSRVIALKNYGLVKNGYAVVGLTVDTIFTKSVAGSTIPVIDELSGKNFDKVFIMLGDNECGWSSKDVFVEKYSRVIAAVKERVPDAEIYLQSILPVSQTASDTSPFGVTNANIDKMNVLIEELAADNGVKYINPASALKNSNGVLPDEASSDGIHLNKKYCKIWLTYIIDNVFSEEAE